MIDLWPDSVQKPWSPSKCPHFFAREKKQLALAGDSAGSESGVLGAWHLEGVVGLSGGQGVCVIP